MENSGHGVREKLTASRFEGLLQRLHPDRERAAEKYEFLRWQLMKFFQWNGCAPGEELVDETFDRVAVILEERQVDEVGSFAWGVARNIKREAQRRAVKVVRIPDLVEREHSGIRTEDPNTTIHEQIESERRLKCLYLCMQRMPEGSRQAFIVYHGECERSSDTRKRLAADLGISSTTLKVRMNRLRQKLQECVKRCYQRRLAR
jgi:RNA polymerase sigma factor (sigma-70 family)